MTVSYVLYCLVYVCDVRGVCVYVHKCVCAWEREREWVCVCVWESAYVCVRVCVLVYLYIVNGYSVMAAGAKLPAPTTKNELLYAFNNPFLVTQVPSYVWHDSFICVTRRIHMCDITCDITRHTCTSSMNHSSSRSTLPWLIPNMSHDLFIYITWPIHNVWHDTF